MPDAVSIAPSTIAASPQVARGAQGASRVAQLAWGLADVIAPLAELEAAALKLANEIADNAPLAVQSTRATLRAGLADAVKARTDHEMAEQTWLRKTKDFAEGVRAVNERRAGNFVGA